MRAVTVAANLTANTLTTLYTVPTGYYARVVLLRATNASSSNKHITFDVVDASPSATFSIVYQEAVTAKTVKDWGGGLAYFVMEEGDILKATSEAASTFAVFATIEQIGLTRQ